MSRREETVKVDGLKVVLDQYRDAVQERACGEMVNDFAESGQVAEDTRAELEARQAVVSYIVRHFLPVSNKHVHDCGSCGQRRECYHAACYFNGLADCDPGTGCRTKRPIARRRRG